MKGAQLGLFADRLSGGFGQGQRHALDATSWLDFFPGWHADHAHLYDVLAARPDWEQRSRWMFTEEVTEPRLTAELHSLDDVAEVRAIAARLSQHYGVVYDSTWMNLYRNHEDSTGWHADRPVNKRESAIVPVLILGATRRFVIRPKEGGKSTVFTVAAGDLVVMGGRCQRDWVHAVPKETTPSGPRISVNFGSRAQSTQ